VDIIAWLIGIALGGLMLRWIIEGGVENGVTKALRAHHAWLNAQRPNSETGREDV
jgi:hypothetical protein